MTIHDDINDIHAALTGHQCKSTGRAYVSELTRQHEREAICEDRFTRHTWNARHWNRVVRNRVAWNHDARIHLNGVMRAVLWHAIY